MRVIGESNGRCDATLARGAVSVVDPEISGWSGVLYLCEAARSRFRDGELSPREWFRLACRVGPHYRLLGEECYSRFGEEYDADPKEYGSSDLFPSSADVARSPRTAVMVGVAWSAEDYFAEVGDGSLRSVINRHAPEAVYSSLDSVIARKRQVGEIRDVCYMIVERLIDAPKSDWVERQWPAHGVESFMTLTDLSLRVWPWNVVEERATPSLAVIPGERRRWKTSGWHRLMQAAPAVERARLRDKFLVGVPAADRDLVVRFLERPGE
jgi:hypothetical protein